MILRFILQSIAISILIIATYCLVITLNVVYTATYAWQIFTSVFLISILSVWVVLKIGAIDKNYFFTAILASIVLRLLAFGVLNFFFIYFDRSGAIANVVLFFSYYFIMTLIETIFLFKITRKV